MIAVSLGFGAALSWGLADFLGGIRTKQLTLPLVLLVSQFTALAAAALVVAVGGLDAPPFGEVAPALAAGCAQLAGISALYRALSIGTMSVISPISASGAAVIPVVAAVATGERPDALQLAGMGAAFAGVVLATRAPEAPGGGPASRRALALSATAAVGFGIFYVGMDAAVEDAGPFWALLVARSAACLSLLVVLAALRPSFGGAGASARVLPVLALIGLLDVGANACFALGTDTGLLSVVSVLASLYPVTTVVLARALLDERLVRIQAVGVAVALAGVALIAAG